MIEIHVCNSNSYIKNLPYQVSGALKRHLSFFNPNYIFSTYEHTSQFISCFNRKTGLFPTGLLRVVKEFLEKGSSPYQIFDRRQQPSSAPQILRLYQDPPSLRPYQQYCIDLTDRYERGAFSIPTGLGKTLIATMIAHKKGVPTLFIVPSVNLVQQTYDVFERYFSRRVVGRTDEGKMIEVSTYQSLCRKNEEYFKRFDMLILDESHHASCSSISDTNKDFWGNIFYRYYLSATLYRNDGSDLKLFGVVGDCIFHYPVAQAIKDGWIVPPYFFFFNVYNKDKCPGSSYMDEYKTHIVHNEERNQLIKRLGEQLVSQGRQIIIMVKEIEHGEYLSSLLSQCSIFIKGESDRKGVSRNKQLLKSFSERKFPILIATSVLGEGTDVPSADTIINASGMKAKSETIQKAGRILRLLLNDPDHKKPYALFFDFNDLNGGWVSEHSRERMSHFKEYDTKIEVVE